MFPMLGSTLQLDQNYRYHCPEIKGVHLAKLNVTFIILSRQLEKYGRCGRIALSADMVCVAKSIVI